VRFPRAAHLVCFSLDQLDYIKKTWGTYYNNTLRPHKGVGMTNDGFDQTFQPQFHGTVKSKQQLGGIIKSYYRDAD
jgi:putative transposase